MPSTATPKRGVAAGQADGTTEQTARATPDWELIERLYRAGVLSLREIGKRGNVSEGAIRKRAKTAGWSRDLTAKVQERVRTELVRKSVRNESTSAQLRTEAAIVEEAAATVVEIVEHHRTDIRRGRHLVTNLLDQLAVAADNREALEDAIHAATETKTGDGLDDVKIDFKRRNAMLAAISLPEHAGTARSLANALKTLIGLERQAYAIETSPLPDPAPEAEEAENNDGLDAFIARLDARVAQFHAPAADPAAAG